MICPKCQTDSIPFGKAWIKSGRGTYHCPCCGVALAVVIALDAFMDFRLRRLELIEPEV
jgi:hypothetical protein